MEQWPHFEARVVDGVLVLPQPRWQDFAATLVLEGAQLSLQLPIAFPQPLLVELVQGDRLLEFEQVFRPPGAVQGASNLGFGVLALVVA